MAFIKPVIRLSNMDNMLVQIVLCFIDKYLYFTALVKEGIFCPLYRHPNMQIVVDIILQNIPLVEEIDLGHNKINCLDELGRIVSTCSNLHRLSLKKNKVSDEVIL